VTHFHLAGGGVDVGAARGIIGGRVWAETDSGAYLGARGEPENRRAMSRQRSISRWMLSNRAWISWAASGCAGQAGEVGLSNWV